jgi:uncharacterized repeat protein (TIGR03987 family)
MTAELIISSTLITLALIFYSIGVWSERLTRRLRAWHLIFFWGGLLCDTFGTGVMFEMSGGISSSIHSLTGLAAILLMLIHAVWATVVLLLKNEKAILNFHHFSIFVWLIWLVPYLNGFFAAMR